MKALTRSPRTPSNPSYSPHNLNMYALAASAAGVSLLALAQPSQAKILYTKTNQIISTNGVYPLDLNHDGTVDFLIQQQGLLSSGSEGNGVWAKEAFGNAVQGSTGLYSWTFASALKEGATIGPNRRFVSNSEPAGEIMAEYVCTYNSCRGWIGQWVNVANRYLGLRFQIDGRIHYGWVRLSIQTQSFRITARLTGYAYETIVNKTIRAGRTSGADDGSLSSGPPDSAPDSAAPVVESASHAGQSLGRLALGALGRHP
jgi:hypothetical protein